MSQGRLLSARARRLFLLGFVVLVVAAFRRRAQLQAWLGPCFEAVDQLGPSAGLVLMLAYIPACLCMVPNTFITPGVGFVMGAVPGTIVALIGATLGAAVNYGVARLLGRNWFDQHVASNYRIRAIDIACRTRGFQIVLLTRLTPVFPSNFMSYFYGVTNVRFTHYLGASALGMLPRILVGATVGAAAKSFADSVREPLHEQSWMLYSVAGVTIVALILLGQIASRALQQALAEAEATLPVESRPVRLDEAA